MTFDITEEEYLAHYGTPRHSGRYPYGSGGEEASAQRSKRFLDYVADMKAKGLSDKEIYEGLGMTSTEYRAQRSIARAEKKADQITTAQRLKNKGMSNIAIGAQMGLNESSVRALLAPGEKMKVDVIQTTAKELQELVDKQGYTDIGGGVENQMGISKERLGTAVSVLQAKGYVVETVQIDQFSGSSLQKTYTKVLAPPGTTYRDIVANKGAIKPVKAWSDDGGISMLGIDPPLSISTKRIKINYDEDGGSALDGVIYVRPGVKDLSMGQSRYAQVRIAVGGTHYLKGMAMYKDDLPPGVDIVFNTNKKKSEVGTDKLAVMKAMKDDPDNPFGSAVRQIYNTDKHGNQKRELGVASAMNLVNEQGDWEKWKKSISSQVLSKQSPVLAKAQLDMTYERRSNQLKEIMALTNPSVRKKLLEDYASDVDAAAIHLKAAALPRQRSHVLLPINSLKESEIHAPNYRDGERVALIRYPHGGVFEIPELTVNNRNPEAVKALGRQSRDVVGINSEVAKRLSGADFDGDTVLVIPQGGPRSLKTAPPLEKLKDFDPQIYKLPDDSPIPRMKEETKQIEMGKVSNLITDMTIKKASNADLARAVRHSMVVIDAEKHNLNYRQSYIDNGIRQLREKYQSNPDKPNSRGSSTLISRARGPVYVDEKKLRKASKGGPVDPETGRLVFEPTGAVGRDGKPKQMRSVQLRETDDAHTLSSGTPIERIYADHSNKLKDLANDARKASLSTQKTPWSESAKKAYAPEVAELDAALNIALKNRPRERQALILASSTVSAKRQANPEMTREEIKKLQGLAIKEARTRTGAGKERIVITDRQWEAIQAGAISPSKLTKILNNADMDRVKTLATPKVNLKMTASKTNRARQMATLGYTQAEIADALGVSLTTLKSSLSE